MSHSIDEIARMMPLSVEQTEHWVGLLRAVFTDVVPGDRLVGTFDPQTGATFYLNDAWLGQLSDLSLSRAFFDIWLSENTSRPKLRADLLGMSE